jgi:hypothetical protein
MSKQTLNGRVEKMENIQTEQSRKVEFIRFVDTDGHTLFLEIRWAGKLVKRLKGEAFCNTF